jgi:hypothetical protein
LDGNQLRTSQQVTVYHKELAAGRWKEFPLLLQMAHIGGEVERALKWRDLGKAERFESAYARAMELVDLTVAAARTPASARELSLLKSALVDFFHGSNQMGSSPEQWRKYFDAFAYAARRDR